MSEQSIGRRGFVGAVAAAAAAGLVGQGAGDAFAVGGMINVATATAATFQPYVGQTFKVSGSSALLTLDSIHVVDDSNKSKRPARIRNESFSLIFTAPEGTRLPSDSCTLTNASMNAFSLFVTEVGPTTSKAYFEAPFN